MGPFARTTGLDHVPLDNTAAAADAAGAATDTSAQTNVNGANDVAAHSQAEAAEIAAVPDPQSPAGQAAILAIIERYQGQSAGTVQTSATAEQAAGQQAASAGTDQGSAAAKSDTKPADDAKSSDTREVFGQCRQRTGRRPRRRWAQRHPVLAARRRRWAGGLGGGLVAWAG